LACGRTMLSVLAIAEGLVFSYSYISHMGNIIPHRNKYLMKKVIGCNCQCIAYHIHIKCGKTSCISIIMIMALTWLVNLLHNISE
jgi:hypothetical protein